CFLDFLLYIRTLPTSAPFPSTTLFRSGPPRRRHHLHGAVGAQQAAAGLAPAVQEGPLLQGLRRRLLPRGRERRSQVRPRRDRARSEEHTSELQSRENLVCRLLLEKKKK